jgi:hypothetical protein
MEGPEGQSDAPAGGGSCGQRTEHKACALIKYDLAANNVLESVLLTT